jgi:MerR family transcriptional regulator, light-induced transcriptional regulator
MSQLDEMFELISIFSISYTYNLSKRVIHKLDIPSTAHKAIRDLCVNFINKAKGPKGKRFFMEIEVSGQYSIQLASKISGVGVHTIRAWEKRYQAVVPDRNSSGRREYNDKDIERLSLLSELCTLGHTIGKIAQLSTSELKLQLQKLGKNPEHLGPTTDLISTALGTGPLQLKNSLDRLFDALEEYKIHIISEEFNRLLLILNPRELVMKVIAPLITQVEKGVIEGKYNLGQENALSALIKFHCGHILFRANQSKSTRPIRVVLCTPEGCFNEMGILQAALICSFYNLQFYYLGPNLPEESLMDAYNSLNGNIVLLETRVRTQTMPKNFLRNYCENVAKALGDGQLILDHSQSLSSEDSLALNQLSNITTLQDIEELDNYFKSL